MQRALLIPGVHTHFGGVIGFSCQLQPNDLDIYNGANVRREFPDPHFQTILPQSLDIRLGNESCSHVEKALLGASNNLIFEALLFPTSRLLEWLSVSRIIYYSISTAQWRI